MPRRRRLWFPVLVMVAGVIAVTAVLLWAPRPVRGWLGGVLAAGFAAYLAQDIPKWLASGRRAVTRRAGEPPIRVTTTVLDVDYLVVTEADRVTELPASGHTVRLVVEAAGPRPVVLTGLRVTVVDRAERDGQLSRHAAQVPVRRFEALLDADPPVLRPLADDAAFPYRVTPDDPEVLDVTARISRGEARWVLHLDWVCDGAAGSTRVDLVGEPLRTAARHSAGSPS